MQIINWKLLGKDEKSTYLERPVESLNNSLESLVKDILNDIKTNKDRAIRRYSKLYDNVELDSFYVQKKEIDKALLKIDEVTKKAIDKAYRNIHKFHKLQYPVAIKSETTQGVFCEKRYSPISSVGLYIPSGTAALFSSVLMLAIPAKIAGCKNIVISSPPNKEGEIDPMIIYCAQLCGVDNIIKLGGAQAIAAMAYGSESIDKVDKIFGPGNSYVAEAKRQVSLDPKGAAQDLIAGPSELLIICDKYADPAFVAADILSQAEHDKSSQVICLVDSESYARSVSKQINIQIKSLKRKLIAREALSNSKLIVYSDIENAMEISNQYCPEHLIINTKNNLYAKDLVENAGSVFIGQYASESFGDYASGTNHVLPTYGQAKTQGGLDILSFMKSISYQTVNERGFLNLAPCVELMADLEGLDAHKKAVTIRRKRLNEESKQ